jgi:ABC-type multidrug transport system fused ATPase/permease subunit
MNGGRSALFDREAWHFLFSFYREKAWRLAPFLAAGAMQALLLLPPLYIVRMVFDVAIPRGDARLLVWLGAGLVASRILASCVSLVTRSISLDITRSATAALRCDLLSALTGASREFYVQNEPSRVLTRVVQESERIEGMSNTLLSLAPVLLAAAALMAGLLWLNWRLTLALVAVAPIIWLVFTWSGARVKRAVRIYQAAFEDFSKGVSFLVNHLDLIKSRAFEDEESRRQAVRVEKLRSSGRTMAMTFAQDGQVQSNLTGLAATVILVAGGFAIQQHSMSLGAFFAFFVAANMLTAYADRVTAALPELIAGTESLLTLLRLRHEQPRALYRGTIVRNCSGNISIRNAGFEHAAAPILRDVSIELRPRTTTAIVGSNGSGKTTLVNLILGLYRPQSGALFADGTPYDTLDLRVLRRGMGVVPQQPTYFTGTVLENIAYGWPDLGRDAAMAAAKRADADAMIRSLPQGYDTPIGEGGARLSGGEAQKIAIARALIARPKMLILDEPTNHLDPASMLRIMKALTEDRDRPAILIVSHDSGVVGFADEVFSIDAGRLSQTVHNVVGDVA